MATSKEFDLLNIVNYIVPNNIHHAYIFINNPFLNREAILIGYKDN
jgi:hypothetical protein